MQDPQDAYQREPAGPLHGAARATADLATVFDGAGPDAGCSVAAPLISGSEARVIIERLTALENAVERLIEAVEARDPASTGSDASRPNRPERHGGGGALSGEESSLSGYSGLSSREIEVFELIAEGYRVSTVARELFVSPSTVRNHLSAIFRKLGVSSQAQLLERLRRAGVERPS